jgi:hypothetical protein
MYTLILFFTVINQQGMEIDSGHSRSISGFSSYTSCQQAGERIHQDVRRGKGVWWGAQVTFSCVRQ